MFLGLLSGVIASTAGVRPTGSAVVDVVLVGVLATAVTWAGATAPWWLIAAVGLLAAGVSATPLLLAAAMAAVLLASAIGAQRRNLPLVRELAVLLALQVLARSQVYGFLGLSSLLACTALAAVFFWGVRRRPRSQRKVVWRVLQAAGATAAILTVGFVLAALSARGSITEGNRQARAGLAAINRGDTAAAATAFAAAATSFHSADDQLSAPWAQGARLLPVFAQHRDGLSGIASAASAALGDAASALRGVDPETVRVVDGQIDIEAVRQLEAPFTELDNAIITLQHAVQNAKSPWLAGQVQRQLGELTNDLTKNRVRADNALQAVRLAPEMLGASGQRRYFIAFTTPAEARGLGGFMGNWAEITITDGKLALTAFGRSVDLNRGSPTDRRLTGLDELVSHWGRFGFADAEDGTADSTIWSNVTMAPDFPTTAQAIQQLYPQSGGRPIDGVFLLDPQAIAALLEFTGPIDVDGVAQPLTEKNAAQFILRDQYLEASGADRVDLLDTIAHITVERLLSTSLPPPAELASVFAPLAAEGRFMAWSAHDDEQSLLASVKMDGSFPQLAGADGVAVTVDNAAANKLDAYLEMTVDYEVTSRSTSGERSATVTITLTNSAPSAGLPPYVIGNAVGLPDGTNHMWLSVYTALPMVGTTIDGEPTGMQTSSVFGWNVATRFVDVPPGATVVVTLSLDGVIGDESAPLVQRVQPLA
ncbi:hypothetical protein BH10ACT2_BH10ACT2_21060 [soil metagenome]